MKRSVLLFVQAACALALLGAAEPPSPGRLVSERFRQLTRAAEWRLATSHVLGFDAYHPQGLVKIGETFYLSAVEVRKRTQPFPKPQGGFDRDVGAGHGHLFKFDAEGRLLADLLLGEGTIYHPGGIDYDGQFIWVPVAEYRPGSRSIIYRVDPVAMRATEVFRYADHVGGIVHDRDGRALYGLSWGSRRVHQWPLDASGHVTGQTTSRRNGAFYIDYQDCKALGRGEMLCGGLGRYRTGERNLPLGGLELVDLASGRPIHQLPIELVTRSGLPMTQNPFWSEPTDSGLRFYFVPEDRRSTLYVYEVRGSAVPPAHP